MATALTRTEHYVSRPDGRVYYAKEGEGEPLLLLHSAHGSGWTWRKVIDAFARHYTCYNVDLPGYDHSDIPPRPYSVEDFLEAIIDVLDSAGISQTSILGSHTGAMIAVLMSATYPERVRKMVLNGMPYWSKEGGRDYFKMASTQDTDTTSYDRPVRPLTTWEEASASNPDLTHEFWEKREEIARKSRYWSRLTIESITSFDMTPIGPRVKAPSLILNGDGERIRFSEKAAQNGIAGTTLKVIEGSPRPVHEHKPEEFTRLALDFLLED
ncbi:MAG: alpha/beta hydrolase [Chloroflexi bacterium]|nr:alpha/beta hydrolase [Chloroflexota bacterium]MCZ6892306.1 alpha/beta hydrolase [Chloroflexota bacterium]